MWRRLAKLLGSISSSRVEVTWDIKIILLIGYIAGYAVAIYGPICVDPHLISYAAGGPRTYEYENWAYAIGIALVLILGSYFTICNNLMKLYLSVFIFLGSLIPTFYIFSGKEILHGNILAAGIATTILSLFSLFIWHVRERFYLSDSELMAGREQIFEFLKAQSGFARQTTVAVIGLLAALYYGAFQLDFQFTQNTVKNANDKLLLQVNIQIQISFYAIYTIIGAVRYLFEMNMKLLEQSKQVAKQLDNLAKECTHPFTPPDDDDH